MVQSETGVIRGLFHDAGGEAEGRELADIISAFAAEKGFRQTLRSNFESQRVKVESRLSEIWCAYQLGRDPRGTIQQRISDAKIASKKLNKATEALRETPRSFLFIYHQMDRKSISEFDRTVEAIQAMADNAEFFAKHKKLPDCLKGIAPLRNAAVALTVLYSDLTGKPFSKTLKVEKGVFRSDGPRLVHQLLKYIEPSVVISQVATALRQQSQGIFGAK
jgi:hypothetical protein